MGKHLTAEKKHRKKRVSHSASSKGGLPTKKKKWRRRRRGATFARCPSKRKKEEKKFLSEKMAGHGRCVCQKSHPFERTHSMHDSSVDTCFGKRKPVINQIFIILGGKKKK